MTQVSKYALRGASVLDGTGSAASDSTVIIQNEVIVDVIGQHEPLGADYQTIELAGTILCPGFVDVHSHADNAPFLQDDDLSKIMQGVTTEVMGNCGFSLAPRQTPNEDIFDGYATRIFPPLEWNWNSFEDMLAAADERGYVTNYAPMLGHHTIRIAAMGMRDEHAVQSDLEHMFASIDEAAASGVVGFSTGLIYPPGLFSASEELEALVGRIPENAVYATHMRGEGAQVFSSIAEALEVGEKTGRRLQISHLKVAGKYNWGRMSEALELISNARDRGVDVRQDIYPYTAGSTMLTACLPPWFQEGGNSGVLRRLNDPVSIERLKQDLAEVSLEWENMVFGAGWEGIVVSSTADHQFEGQSLLQISEERNIEPVEALRLVLLEEDLQATMTVHQMSEDDVITALQDEYTMIGSDGLPPGTGGKPHPRMYGTFPRVLGRFSRTLNVLPLPEAVRRMTSLPADTFGLTDRGLIKPGFKADIVAFNAAEVNDTATFENPVVYPEGIPWVMINCQIVVEAGQYFGGRRGQRLKRGE